MNNKKMNIEHRTFNIEHRIWNKKNNFKGNRNNPSNFNIRNFIRRWTFDVRCWTFIFNMILSNNPKSKIVMGHALRASLFALLTFTPLARGSVQPWAITIIEMITLFALTLFLLEKCLVWEWKWIKTPLDKPIIALIILSIVSIIFSLHKQISIRSFTLFLTYPVIFYLIINTVRTRSQFRQLIYVIISVAVFLALFGLFKNFGANPFSCSVSDPG